MSAAKSLPHYIETFFRDHLAGHRGVSPNTVRAYRDAIKLFLLHLARTRTKKVTAISADDMTAETVLAFLDDIEGGRGNTAITRNHRLAALRSFFSYLATNDVLRLGQYQKILMIPRKRAARPMMGYLEVDEVSAVLRSIDRSTWAGRRDHALLQLLYNTGARVQEICDLTVEALRLEAPPLATITGKGRKTRQVPLWPETKQILHRYLVENDLLSRAPARIFANARGAPLGRFGVRYIIHKYVRKAIEVCPKLAKKTVGPHTFRHTTAMHLLQSGVDLTVIRAWLGHVDIATTHAYVEIDMEMKRKALAKCNPGQRGLALARVFRRHQDIVGWLETL
jgi:site-specific recombinase XerD